MQATPRLIALDWGTSSCRAFLLGDGGIVLERRADAGGILTVPKGGFPAAFAEKIAGWPRLPVLAAGMVGSAQGWEPAPYCPCPAGAAELARGLMTVQRLRIVPGVMQTGAHPDVMRGEETQIIGALARQPRLAAASRFVLPGTHSKWARVGQGRITGFTTYMTGELFAVLRRHSILGRLAHPEAAPSLDAFTRGVDAARASRLGMAPLLFSARALVLAETLAPDESLDYLSGLLIGEELRCALADPADAGSLVIIGEESLAARYRLALACFDVLDAVVQDGAAEAGLWTIARAAGLVES
jgi:2-dehydro-3-deoxygalactonokinase